MLCIAVLCAASAGAGTGETAGREAEIREISRTIDACIGWFKTKDFDLLFSVVAHDSAYVSVHPTDRVIRGWDQFLANSEVFRNPEFKYKRHQLTDLTVNVSRCGDVAWFYCVLDDMNTWKGQPANWENARWTGVLEKRDGRWRIVQQHFSFAAE
jgi:ketosteroid isomerase-like protein